jgi:hypothetical protein
VAAELATSRKLPAIYELVGRESGHMGINREGWGRVCGGQQVAGENLYRIGRGEIQGYGLYQICIKIHFTVLEFLHMYKHI